MVQLVDGYSRQPAFGVDPVFRLDGAVVRPFAKPEAFYAFTGLGAEKHRLRVETPDFFPLECDLAVLLGGPLAEGIVTCSLVPGPLYAYSVWNGLIRGRVTRAKMPLAGVTISATYTGRGKRTVSRRTQTWAGGAYDGRYAVSFGDRLPPNTDITLDFVAPGGATSRRQVKLSPGAAVFADVEFN